MPPSKVGNLSVKNKGIEQICSLEYDEQLQSMLIQNDTPNLRHLI